MLGIAASSLFFLLRSGDEPREPPQEGEELAENPVPATEPSWSLDQLEPAPVADKNRMRPEQDQVAVLQGTDRREKSRVQEGLVPKSKGGYLAFTPDSGKLLGVAWGDTFWIWDVARRNEIVSVKLATEEGRAETRALHALTLAPDGQTVAMGHRRTVRLWKVSTRQQIANLQGHAHLVLALAYSPDGGLLAAGSGVQEVPADAGEVKIWYVQTGKERVTIPLKTAVQVLAFAPDGKTLAFGGWNGGVTLWDVDRLREQFTRYMDGSITCLAFSQDGQTLAAGDTRGRVRLWNTARGKERPTQLGHQQAVTAMAFADTGQTLLTVDTDGRAILWDEATGDQLRDWTARVHFGVTVSPDGRHLAALTHHGTAAIFRLIPAGERKHKP